MKLRRTAFLSILIAAHTFANEDYAQTDSLASAIEQASLPDEPKISINEIEAKVINDAKAEVVKDNTGSALPISHQEPSAHSFLPVSGGNQHFDTPTSSEPFKIVVGRLNPPLVNDEIIDPVLKERARIRMIGDYQAYFRNAQLISVVRALAEHAQMRYVTSASEALNTPVTISGTYNTLDLLDILQDHYGVSMSFNRGTWRFNKATPSSLVYRSYRLKNNSREVVEISSPTIENSLGSESNNTTSVNGGSGAFKVSYDGLVKDVVDHLSTPLPMNDTGLVMAHDPGKAFFIPETNELIVIASEFHQGLVVEYLKRVDRPLEQIEFSAYFVENTKSPERELGIDWSNAVRSTVSGSNAPGDSSFVIPRATILNSYQFAAALKFTQTDTSSFISQSPTVVGMPNRKTVLDASSKIPVAQSTTDNNSNAASTTTSSLEYISVGTIVNIFPVIFESDDGSKRIRLHVSLVVSSITGERIISGNPAPETAQRRFEFSMEVPDSQTLVIGGLVSSSTTTQSNEVPFLSSIPGVGRLFRTDLDKATRSNMTVYITPRIINSSQPTQIAALPRVWPNDLAFNRPPFISDNASLSGVRQSLDGFSREIAALETYNAQNRDPAEIMKRLRGLSGELEEMTDYLSSLKREGVKVDPFLSDEITIQAKRTRSLRIKMMTQVGNI